MKMNKLSVAAVSACVLTAITSAKADLVIDGNFSEGSAAFTSDWHPYDAALDTTTFGSQDAAAFDTQLQSGVYLGKISQTVDLPAGALEDLTFWAAGAGDLTIRSGSTVIENNLAGSVGVDSSDLTEFNFLFTPATGGDQTLSITWVGSNVGYMTGISVVDPSPIPEASTVMAGALMLLPLGVGVFRSLRKARTP